MNGSDPDDKLEECGMQSSWDECLFNGVVGFCNVEIDGRNQKLKACNI